MNKQHSDRWLLAAMSAACAAVFAAPLLAASAHPSAAALFYMLFAPLCHQARERSFLLLGFPLAVCARCTGIYAGVWLVTAAAAGRTLAPSRRWMLLALGLMAADVATELAGLRPPVAWLRFSTGFMVGLAGGVWLIHSARVLEAEVRERARTSPRFKIVPGTSRWEQVAALARIFR